MPEIYSLTSSHAFGIISNIIPDQACAERVLKTVYARLWEQRDRLGSRQIGDPLSYLRRLTHRSAMDYKFQMNIKTCMETGVTIASEINPEEAEALGVSEKDMRILRLAYLNGASISEISKRENLGVDLVESSLQRTVRQLRGAKS